MCFKIKGSGGIFPIDGKSPIEFAVEVRPFFPSALTTYISGMTADRCPLALPVRVRLLQRHLPTMLGLWRRRRRSHWVRSLQIEPSKRRKFQG